MNINEAQVTMSIDGFKTSDLSSLAKMIEIASVASEDEVGDMMGGVATAPVTPDPVAVAASPVTEPLGSGMDSVEMIGDEPAIADDEVFALDNMAHDVEDDDDVFESSLDRISEMAGITRILPDLDLEEDAFNDEEEGLVGTFDTRDACVADAEAQTNGVEGEHFVIISDPEGFYWKRPMQQEAVEQFVVPTGGITNSVHATQHKIGQKVGDNTMAIPGEDSESDEELEELRESINQRFAKFMGE